MKCQPSSPFLDATIRPTGTPDRNDAAGRLSTPLGATRLRREGTELGYGLDGIGANTVVQACWSMCLAARALGEGATYITLLNRVHDGVNRIIGVPPDVSLKLYAALPMGY